MGVELDGVVYELAGVWDVDIEEVGLRTGSYGEWMEDRIRRVWYVRKLVEAWSR